MAKKASIKLKTVRSSSKDSKKAKKSPKARKVVYKARKVASKKPNVSKKSKSAVKHKQPITKKSVSGDSDIKLKLLYKIDSIRDANPELKPLVEEFSQEMTNLLRSSGSAVILSNPESGDLQLVHADQKATKIFKVDGFKKIMDFSANTLKNKKTLLSNKPTQLSKIYTAVNSVLAQPLIINRKELGVFVFLNKKDDFTKEDLILSEAFATQADSAVDHAMMYSTLVHRNKELSALYKIDNIRDKYSEDLSLMLDKILVEIVNALDSKSGYIMLFNYNNEELELKANSQVLKSSEKILYHLAEEAIQNTDLTVRNDFNPKVKSSLAIPLIINDRVIGVFGVINPITKEYFDSNDKNILRAIASQADTAIFEDIEKKKIKNLFKRYVAEEVIEKMLKNPDKDYLKCERKYMTVLFSELRGFTSASEETDPTEISGMLNEHLAVMNEIILKNKGTLDKFNGGSIRALFGAPLEIEDHALRAIKVSLEMQRAQAKLAEKWQSEGKTPIYMGVGINTGEMIAGNIGADNIVDYTVIGDNVNIAARLKRAARENQLLISEETYKEVKGKVWIKKIPEIRVNARNNSQEVYEVVGLKSE
ncbi:adenylate/guanylate cyclase domain-containing protein [Nanoarchaeota archaeon]